MVKEINALIDAMSKEEKEELASLQISGGTQDFKVENCLDTSISNHLNYFQLPSSSSTEQFYEPTIETLK